MILIGTREPSETLIQAKTEALPSQQAEKNINTQFENLTKKSKIEPSESVSKAPEDEPEDTGYDGEGSVVDFEDSTIHDEKLDLDELKRKYGY